MCLETHIPQRFLKQGKPVFERKFNDWREKLVKSCLKIKKSLENYVTFSDIFGSEAALLRAISKSQLIENMWHKFQEVIFSYLRLTAPPRSQKYPKMLRNFPSFSSFSDIFGQVFHVNHWIYVQKRVFLVSENARGYAFQNTIILKYIL